MKQEFRVIHTVASLSKKAGGIAPVAAGLCRETGRMGLPTELLSQEVDGVANERNLIPSTDIVSTTLARAYRVPMSGLTLSLCFRRQLHERLSRSIPTVIHNHGLWLPINHQAAVVARTEQVPLVISTHGMLEPWALQHRAWKKRLAWRLYQLADLRAATVLHATAEQEARNLRALGLRQPIAVVPNGIDPPAGRAHPQTRKACRIALFLSRIHPKKGLLELVDAWRIVRPNGWRMVIAGPDEGGHRSVVEKRIRAAGLQDVFQFIGAVEDPMKTELYRSADLFILPTFSENFGLVVGEALACGVPVITTKGAPWPDLETHACGWWIDLGLNALVTALSDSTARPQSVLDEMSERGRLYVEQHFRWSTIAQQMLSVYQWALGQAARPTSVSLN